MFSQKSPRVIVSGFFNSYDACRLYHEPGLRSVWVQGASNFRFVPYCRSLGDYRYAQISLDYLRGFFSLKPLRTTVPKHAIEACVIVAVLIFTI